VVGVVGWVVVVAVEGGGCWLIERSTHARCAIEFSELEISPHSVAILNLYASVFPTIFIIFSKILTYTPLCKRRYIKILF